VEDAGPGVPPAEFDKVFEPFYRPASSRNAAGTGLGLALVRQIARLHGGDAHCVLLDASVGGARSALVVTLPR
jgi:signal transduction histidine kinase